MIGPRYWTTGVTIWRSESGRWGVSLHFLDDGFADDRSTEGELKLRYLVEEDELSASIDLLLEDARRLGIEIGRAEAGGASVYYRGDGEDKRFPPPADWREILQGQCWRLGWKSQ
jgi:hypothetical protein